MLQLFDCPIGSCFRKHEVQHISFTRWDTTCRRLTDSTKCVIFADLAKFHIFTKSYRYCINRYTALTNAIYYNSIVLPNTHGLRIAGYLTSDIPVYQCCRSKNAPNHTKISVWYDTFEPHLFDDPRNRFSYPCTFVRYLRVVLLAQISEVARCLSELGLVKVVIFSYLVILTDFADFALSLARSFSSKPAWMQTKLLSYASSQ